MNAILRFLILSLGGLVFLVLGTLVDSARAQTLYPAYDPTNAGDWVLNESVSDEFNGAQLDETKWHIQGTDGFYYSNFIGRAPSQFSTDNVRLEDGKLKIETRWDPDYPFSPQPGQGGYDYENITTAAVVGKQTYHYGYMEIRAKAADAPVSSSFWMTGSASELDVFEFFGGPKLRNKQYLRRELWSSIHDWSQPPPNSTWTDRLQLPWEVAEDFHTYGVEWNPQYLNFHADGQLVRTVTKAQVEAGVPGGWAIDGPLRTWVDSETFPWHGLPNAGDLSADFEIDYIRVWQEDQTPQLIGDFNGDGFVSQGDLDMILLNWGDTVLPDGFNQSNLATGGPFDGQISQNELDEVLMLWGSGSAPSSVAIPEPTSITLIGLGGVVMSLSARRRKYLWSACRIRNAH